MDENARQRRRVVIAGGGLAGLVAARHLAARGLEVTLFERRETVGGRVRTRRDDRAGYQFDRGFQVLFTAYPAVRRELDLEALALRRFEPGAVVVRPGSRSMLSDPRQSPATIPATLASPEVGLGDAMRVAGLWADLVRTDPDELFDRPDRSIDEYLRQRGFSRRFREHFFAPFYGGITLDRSLSTSSRVFEYTFRALASGDIAVPAAGMGAIPAQLATRVREAGGTLETGVAVTDVREREDGSLAVTTADGTVTAEAVVVATDPPSARELTGVDAIPTESRGCVTQYYRLPGEAALETGGRLVLNAADDAAPNHIAPLSEVAPEYGPADETLLSATFLGTPDAADSELADRTRRALEAWFPEQAVEGLELCHTDRIPFAQFVQPPGIHDRLPDVRDPDGPVYLAGDYTRWSSIQGALESGRQAAMAVLEEL
ncbi:NAD(P)/FAD-dependent oxidoreductase [Natrarchaeobaculum aegyptiacum]|uniref:Phytoene dehydrogenase n=1 Tax=Natrarchaeobaculum aegyptiacum TaxID=745377 RepID=A0A2Z2HSI1_9EURY|nr:NAD(P)/FAD-dependent oxidoreductase [Natrarchaeobaculum aegyptiacum]ARS90156.1 phytoene dehydrogenase [Natrarchaeobaculum aegyptiacum]